MTNQTEISQKSHTIPTNPKYRHNILKTVGQQEGKIKELVNAWRARGAPDSQ